MDFSQALPGLISRFNAAGIRYALIGGLAMAMRGVQRSTLDADFILLLENLEEADSILRSLGYRKEFASENVSHYVSADPALGRIDFLHAFRSATLGMLGRADTLEFLPGVSMPVVHVEDLIGLKIQASVNDPGRHLRDWSDIHQLLQHAGENQLTLDWELIEDYLDLFQLGDKLNELRKIHGEASSK